MILDDLELKKKVIDKIGSFTSQYGTFSFIASDGSIITCYADCTDNIGVLVKKDGKQTWVLDSDCFLAGSIFEDGPWINELLNFVPDK